MLEQKTIYILLTDTGTWLSQMIKLYTRQPLNHVSIAFDRELTEVYSFGRKDPANPFIGGFVREQLYGSLIRSDHRPTQCAIYKMTVSLDVYERLRRRIRHIEHDQERYRYNFLGLIGIVFRVRIERDNAFFCSQFVASVLQYSGCDLFQKQAEWVTPEDFRQCARLEMIYCGDLKQAILNGQGAKLMKLA
ncbi:hypothetical protein [Paenibacillus aquistagni]|uniref:hypothetical protein n=1 Tax=Paenibacillus aquistagni TaxID=1852522 RepID=UPI000B5132B4|nr:hypothetical protein [Paenibacillus aquistagni]